MLLVHAHAADGQVHRSVQEISLSKQTLCVEFIAHGPADRGPMLSPQSLQNCEKCLIMFVVADYHIDLASAGKQCIKHVAEPNRRRWPVRLKQRELTGAVVQELQIGDPSEAEPKWFAWLEQLRCKQGLQAT